MQHSVDFIAAKPKIGIIDDEASVRDALMALLEENGFDPIPMASSVDYVALGETPNLDLVLIDLKLRGESGLSLAMSIREKQNIPIVMLTGFGGEHDKIIGLEVGIDDYLLKPFNPRELIARIRSVLRRSGSWKESIQKADNSDQSKKIQVGNFVIDPATRRVSGQDDGEVLLTNAEYRLLDYFLQNPNKIITRLDLLSEIGSNTARYTDRTIDVLILRLRRKLEVNPSRPCHLQTRRGNGYIFVMSGENRA